MTLQEEQDLRELQGELLEAERSPWQPRVVAQAFRREAPEAPFVLTMQGWIDLSAAQSPFLLGQLPEAEEVLERFAEAFAAFGYQDTTPEGCDGKELVLLGRKMVRAIEHGFSTEIALTPNGSLTERVDNGMGSWLPIFACLVSQIGLSPAEARDLPVAQAFALIAAHRCNEGWRVTGETYAMRDVDEEKAETGNLKAEWNGSVAGDGDATDALRSQTQPSALENP